MNIFNPTPITLPTNSPAISRQDWLRAQSYVGRKWRDLTHDEKSHAVHMAKIGLIDILGSAINAHGHGVCWTELGNSLQRIDINHDTSS